jgi:hypothetical protein
MEVESTFMFILEVVCFLFGETSPACKGDRDFIHLAQQIPCDYIVTDDYLLLLICHRFGLPVKMFPDLIELLVQQSMWSKEQGKKALDAIRVRYKRGFIEHSLRRIDKL